MKTLDMLYPSDYNKKVKFVEPHFLLLSRFSLFFVAVGVVSAVSATVKRRIYKQFASRTRTLNVRHDITRHSPQEQALGKEEQQEMGQQLQMISLTRWPDSDSDSDSLWPLCCVL